MISLSEILVNTNLSSIVIHLVAEQIRDIATTASWKKYSRGRDKRVVINYKMQ